MNTKTAHARVSESGRLSIPADMRRELGLEKGGVVQLKLDENGLHVETGKQFMRRIRAMALEAGWTGKASVDDFLAWKREEARREIEEFNRK